MTFHYAMPQKRRRRRPQKPVESVDEGSFNPSKLIESGLGPANLNLIIINSSSSKKVKKSTKMRMVGHDEALVIYETTNPARVCVLEERIEEKKKKDSVASGFYQLLLVPDDERQAGRGAADAVRTGLG